MEAGSIWKRLREMVNDTGYWPVLTLGDAAMGWTDDAVRAEADLLAVRSIQEGVATALQIDVPAWLAKRRADYADSVDDDEDDLGFEEELAGTWPDGVLPNAELWILNTPLRSAWLDLRLVPTTITWQAPAFFTYGGSSGLEPSEHMAVLREWHRHYGAEVVPIAGDTIELLVERPPRDREAARARAWEQFAYCPDVVIQGTQTVGQLAAQLLGGTTWYF